MLMHFYLTCRNIIRWRSLLGPPRVCSTGLAPRRRQLYPTTWSRPVRSTERRCRVSPKYLEILPSFKIGMLIYSNGDSLTTWFKNITVHSIFVDCYEIRNKYYKLKDIFWGWLQFCFVNDAVIWWNNIFLEE